MNDPRYEVLCVAMRKIAWPIQWLQEYAEDNGCKIDGPAAVQLANDPHYLKQIAQQAMADIARLERPGFRTDSSGNHKSNQALTDVSNSSGVRKSES